MVKENNNEYQKDIQEKLLEIHGDELCTCGFKKKSKGSPICSYPHGRIPEKSIDENHPEGFWSWVFPSCD